MSQCKDCRKKSCKCNKKKSGKSDFIKKINSLYISNKATPTRKR